MEVTTDGSAREPPTLADTKGADADAKHIEQATHSLPDEPLSIIEGGERWMGLGLRELWQYRELFYFLVWRDVKVRYKQTVLGAVWAVVQPLFTMLLFTLFFGRLAGVPSDGVPYPVFAYAGLLLWTFFANGVTNGAGSLVGSSNLITKVYFPRALIPGAAVAAAFVDLAVAFIVLVGLLPYYRVEPTWKLLLLPLPIALAVLLASGAATWFSALNVKYRDVRFALPFLIQSWMFVSPVIYPASLVPARWRWALALNPLTGIIENFRAALFGRQAFDWGTLATSAALSFVLFVCSVYAFRRTEESFADLI